MLGVRPPSFYAPSTWYEAVADPKKKSDGKQRGSGAVADKEGKKAARLAAAASPTWFHNHILLVSELVTSQMNLTSSIPAS
ncbi:unnamed protein product [Phytophthora fragariaefolia]|uniref:Unnamed protein product n=1 Tax=Phytophthora fragariaefolia TaxID=1490495 RepID=A0A9W6Y2L7_9STRA|nr:unnamed protein product [Phytophthora fragariaefolia]